MPTSPLPDISRRGRRPAPPRHLADLTPEQRRQAVGELGEPAYRARQLAVHDFGHLLEPGGQAAAGMTDLPATSRTRLSAQLLPALLTPIRRQECDDGGTVKALWRLFDGALVESVVMRYPDRITVCVSSQAGCGIGCPFCATGQAGLTRNLSCAEIVEQVVAAARAAMRGEVGADGRLGERLSNVVFMGMGEPLANYPAVAAALHRLTDPAPDGLGLSARGITVSTVGLVPAVDRLAAEGLAVTLALSLHAPDDPLRDELVPVNTRWRVSEALDAARRYFDATGRRVSIEYALIRDVNADRTRSRLGARQPDPAQPDPGIAVDGEHPRGAAAVRGGAAGARHPDDGPGHAGAGDRRRLRAAGRHR